MPVNWSPYNSESARPATIAAVVTALALVCTTLTCTALTANPHGTHPGVPAAVTTAALMPPTGRRLASLPGQGPDWRLTVGACARLGVDAGWPRCQVVRER